MKSMRVHTCWMFVVAAFFCLVLPQQVQATHLVGGELTYVYQGVNASGQNEFEVHCYIYRDCSSANTNQTGFDNSAAIGVYQGSDLITTVSGNLDFSLVTDVIPQTQIIVLFCRRICALSAQSTS